MLKTPQKEENLKEILMKLKKDKNFLGSLIVQRNGMLIEKILPVEIDSLQLAVMSATMIESIETAIQSIDDLSVNKLDVDFKKHHIIAIRCGDKAILIVLLKKKSNLKSFNKKLNKIKKEILASLYEENEKKKFCKNTNT